MESNFSRLIKKLRSVKKSHCHNMLLIPVILLLLILGLYFSFVPHYVYYTTLKGFSYNGNEWDVYLHFYSQNGFFAQAPIGVNGNLVTHPDSFSNISRYKANKPVIFIKDAISENIHYQLPNFKSGADMAGTEIYIDSDGGEIKSNNLIFPFEGDYEAFLIFPAGFYKYENETTGYYKYKDETIPLGKVIHVSSPESAILFKTNQIMTGLTLIVTGLTIFQIWNSMRGREK